jgi:hypothetical protein
MNHNPHGLKAIPNSGLRAEKNHSYPTPCTALWGGVKGVTSSAALKIYLIKTQVTYKLSKLSKLSTYKLV